MGAWAEHIADSNVNTLTRPTVLKSFNSSISCRQPWDNFLPVPSPHLNHPPHTSAASTTPPLPANNTLDDNMCIDIIYKFPCGCKVSPVGAPYKAKCDKAAVSGRDCWIATQKKDEPWPGRGGCYIHKGKKPQHDPTNRTSTENASTQNADASGKAAQPGA